MLDGVHLDLSDDKGFAASCRQGRELGFDGKTLIHPKQIAAANAAFAPSAEEIEWSRRIIAAHAEAAAAGKGIVLVDGRLIENLHVENARRLERVLTNDPGTGVMRHADAGYDIALDCARENGLDLPAIFDSV